MVRPRGVGLAVLGGAALLGFGAATATGAAITRSSTPAPAGPAVIANAYARTLATGSAEVTLREVVAGDGQHLAVLASGVERFAPPIAMRLTIREGTIGTMAMRLVGGELYIELPPSLRKQIPGDKPWIVIDLAKASGASAAALNSLSSSANEATAMLAYLRGATSVVDDGSATVAGVATTEYTASIDLAKAAALDPSLKSGLANLAGELGSGELPMSVWIDGEHHVRQLGFAFDFNPSAVTSTTAAASSTTTAAPGSALSVTFAMGFTGFGTAVDVTPPPASQTYDATSSLGATA